MPSNDTVMRISTFSHSRFGATGGAASGESGEDEEQDETERAGIVDSSSGKSLCRDSGYVKCLSSL